MNFRAFFLILGLLVLPACQFNPLRVFQAKVPQAPAKPPAQVEGERQAADLLAKGITAPVSLRPVAEGLSNSLGKPEKPLPSATAEQVDKSAGISTERLEAGMVKMQQQLDTLSKQLVKYQGKEIEGTGLSLLGPGMTALIIGLIVLAVACPPVLTLLAFAYRRLKATASIVVNEMEEAANAPETQEAVKAIKAKVRTKMGEHNINTQALKAVVLDLKKKV